MELDRSVALAIQGALAEKKLSDSLATKLSEFLLSCQKVALQYGHKEECFLPLFFKLIELVSKEHLSPYRFANFHVGEKSLYHFGMDFIALLYDKAHSTLKGKEQLQAMQEALERGENVILLGNHQTEADPQLLSLILGKEFENLAEELICVAGDRVVRDPMAVPFSRGRHLICIYSKRYFEYAADRDELLRHNQQSLQIMGELLAEGGKIIYVAPSGGRDRKGADGKVALAPFDSQSLELFFLMASRSQKVCHFHPVAMCTYSVLPPPEGVVADIGESRFSEGGSIHFDFGAPLDLENLVPNKEALDRHAERAARAKAIYDKVVKAYLDLNPPY